MLSKNSLYLLISPSLFFWLGFIYSQYLIEPEEEEEEYELEEEEEYEPEEILLPVFKYL